MSDYLDALIDEGVLTMVENTTAAAKTPRYTKHHPGQLEALAKVGEDEPIFVLRARDPLALMAVQAWLNEAHRCQLVPIGKIHDASLHLSAMRMWARTHGVKFPD